jgi:UDP-2,3-diacylglucosamine pyrophosphatase LpxH
MYDTVFISDVHLGTNRTNIKKFENFIKNLRTKKLVLVGDIIDIYCMEKYKTNWNRHHSNCIHMIMNLMKKGTEIVYVLGNHEAQLRRYCDLKFNNFSMVNEYIHIDSKGNKFLCVHGDKYSEYSSGSWKQLLFNKGYEYVTPLSKILNFNLIHFLKSTKNARRYIENYENDMMNYCRKFDVSGIVVGHIHHSNIKYYDDRIYMCPGDFVDTCSALVEKNGIYCLEHL